MVAETQMLAGNVVGAKTTVFEGIIMSIDKVINFAPSTDRFDWIFGTATGGPAIALESDYIDWFNLGLSDDWDAATTAGKWDIPCYAIFCCVLL